MNKTLITVITLILGLAGIFTYLHGTFFTVRAAEDMKQESITTFQMQQQVLESVIKQTEYKHLVEKLEFLKTQKVVLETQMKLNPSDLIKEKLESVTKQIELTEQKLCEE